MERKSSSNNNHMPSKKAKTERLSRDKAFEELQSIIWKTKSKDEFDEKGNLQRITLLLNQHPGLASEKIKNLVDYGYGTYHIDNDDDDDSSLDPDDDDEGEYYDLFPLLFLIDIGVDDVEILEDVYNLYPAAIEKLALAGEHFGYKFHKVCFFPRYSTDVIRWIVERYPDILLSADCLRDLPIQLFLKRRHWFDEDSSDYQTLRFLVEKCPESLCRRGAGFSAIKTIVSNDLLSIATRAWFVKQAPPDMKIPGITDLELGLRSENDIELVKLILPHVESLDVELPEEEPDLSVRLFESIRDRRSQIRTLIVRDTPRCFQSLEFCQSLLSVLEGETSSITELKLVASSPIDGTVGVVDGLERIFHNNHNLKSLEFPDLELYDGRGLLRFLRGPVSPHTVILRTQDIRNWPQDPTNDVALQVGGGLKVLSIEVRSGTINSLLRDLEGARTLEKLTIYFTEWASDSDSSIIGQRLASILDQVNLRELHCRYGGRVDLNPLCVSLSANSSLKQLELDLRDFPDDDLKCLQDVLESHNNTLGWVDVGDGGKNAIQVQYFTRLNRFGRREFYDPATSRSRIVELISAAIRSSDHCTIIPLSSVIFGLMRAAPSIWCGD